MKRFGLMLTVSVAAFSACGDAAFDPDVVLYYDFETISDGKIVNLANPGTMDGTIVTKNSLAPELVDDSPAARVRQSLTAGTYETSEKALENYISGDRKNGYVECMPTDIDWFSKTNFTVECFFKTANGTQTYTPFFRQRGGGNVIANIGIGDSGQMLYGNVSTNSQVAFRDGNSFSLNEWHHAALVVDQLGETKTARLYLDGKNVTTVTLPCNITNERMTDNGKWYVAGANGGNSYDGSVDSLRVTLRALGPDEFLSIKKFPVGRTLAHVSFDDGTMNADADGGTMTNGVNAVSKADGGALATFSADVPGPIITDGVDGEVLSRYNAKSLSFANSSVTWSGNDQTYFLRKTLAGEDLKSFTVELFFKPNGTQNQWARLITACRNNNVNDRYPYALTFFNNSHVSLRGTRDYFGYADRDCPSVNVCDGKWHHVAFSFAPNAADSAKSDVKFYVDYGAENGGFTSTSSTTNNMVVHPDPLYLVMGTGANGNGYKGLIDELRISVGALEPSQFLRAKKETGTIISFR